MHSGRYVCVGTVNWIREAVWTPMRFNIFFSLSIRFSSVIDGANAGSLTAANIIARTTDRRARKMEGRSCRRVDHFTKSFSILTYHRQRMATLRCTVDIPT